MGERQYPAAAPTQQVANVSSSKSSTSISSAAAAELHARRGCGWDQGSAAATAVTVEEEEIPASAYSPSCSAPAAAECSASVAAAYPAAAAAYPAAAAAYPAAAAAYPAAAAAFPPPPAAAAALTYSHPSAAGPAPKSMPLHLSDTQRSVSSLPARRALRKFPAATPPPFFSLCAASLTRAAAGSASAAAVPSAASASSVAAAALASSAAAATTGADSSAAAGTAPALAAPASGAGASTSAAPAVTCAGDASARHPLLNFFMGGKALRDLFASDTTQVHASSAGGVVTAEEAAASQTAASAAVSASRRNEYNETSVCLPVAAVASKPAKARLETTGRAAAAAAAQQAEAAAAATEAPTGAAGTATTGTAATRGAALHSGAAGAIMTRHGLLYEEVKRTEQDTAAGDLKLARGRRSEKPQQQQASEEESECVAERIGEEENKNDADDILQLFPLLHSSLTHARRTGRQAAQQQQQLVWHGHQQRKPQQLQQQQQHHHQPWHIWGWHQEPAEGGTPFTSFHSPVQENLAYFPVLGCAVDSSYEERESEVGAAGAADEVIVAGSVPGGAAAAAADQEAARGAAESLFRYSCFPPKRMADREEARREAPPGRAAGRHVTASTCLSGLAAGGEEKEGKKEQGAEGGISARLVLPGCVHEETEHCDESAAAAAGGGKLRHYSSSKSGGSGPERETQTRRCLGRATGSSGSLEKEEHGEVKGFADRREKYDGDAVGEGVGDRGGEVEGTGDGVEQEDEKRQLGGLEKYGREELDEEMQRGKEEKDERRYDLYGFKQDEVSEALAREYSLRVQAQTKQRYLEWTRYFREDPEFAKTNLLKRLIRTGIPNAFRREIWAHCLGSDLLLKRHGGLFEKMAEMTLRKETSDQIELDIRRTFPNNKYFEGPAAQGVAALRLLLHAFAAYKPEVNYCQSLNFVGGMLLLYMPPPLAFWSLVQLVDSELDRKGMSIASYYTPGMQALRRDLKVLEFLLKKRVPRVLRALRSCGLDVSGVCAEWFLCIYSTTLPFATAVRVWDSVMFEGQKIFFRVALAIFRLFEEELLHASAVEDIMVSFKWKLRHLVDREELLRVAFGGVGRLSRREIARLQRRMQLVVEKEEQQRRRRTLLLRSPAPPAARHPSFLYPRPVARRPACPAAAATAAATVAVSTPAGAPTTAAAASNSTTAAAARAASTLPFLLLPFTPRRIFRRGVNSPPPSAAAAAASSSSSSLPQQPQQHHFLPFRSSTNTRSKWRIPRGRDIIRLPSHSPSSAARRAAARRTRSRMPQQQEGEGQHITQQQQRSHDAQQSDSDCDGEDVEAHRNESQQQQEQERQQQSEQAEAQQQGETPQRRQQRRQRHRHFHGRLAQGLRRKSSVGAAALRGRKGQVSGERGSGRAKSLLQACRKVAGDPSEKEDGAVAAAAAQGAEEAVAAFLESKPASPSVAAAVLHATSAGRESPVAEAPGAVATSELKATAAAAGTPGFAARGAASAATIALASTEAAAAALEAKAPAPFSSAACKQMSFPE